MVFKMHVFSCIKGVDPTVNIEILLPACKIQESYVRIACCSGRQTRNKSIQQRAMQQWVEARTFVALGSSSERAGDWRSTLVRPSYPQHLMLALQCDIRLGSFWTVGIIYDQYIYDLLCIT